MWEALALAGSGVALVLAGLTWWRVHRLALWLMDVASQLAALDRELRG